MAASHGQVDEGPHHEPPQPRLDPHLNGEEVSGRKPALPSAVVLPGVPISMPGRQCPGRNDRGYLCQKLPSEALGLAGQATALVVVELKSPVAELLAKYPIFLA